MATYSDLDGVTKDAFKVAKATVSAVSVATAQTFTLPATGGTFALTTDIVGGTRFIDGGNASSVYTVEQIVDGGGA
jgi:hypothetical protein